MALKKYECPICGQGWVEPVRIRNSGQIVYVCSESEETWLSETDIGPNTWSNVPQAGHYSYLNQVMESVGLGASQYEELEWLDTE